MDKIPSRCTYAAVLCDREGKARPDLRDRVICDQHVARARLFSPDNPRRQGVAA